MWIKLNFTLFLFIFSPFILFGQDESIQKTGKASFYHANFHGRETSNGEMYDMDDFTAAHKTLPFNTLLLVTNRINNKSVIVRVNDRGPFKRSRIIDLSLSAAKKIGMVRFGVVPVKINILKFLNTNPVNDSLIEVNYIWDCYGNMKSLNKSTVFVWKTDDWKHAFYMGSSLTLDYKTDSLVILISGPSDNRNYYLLITGMNNDKEAESLISKLKKDGFSNSRLFTDTHLKAALHDGRQEK